MKPFIAVIMAGGKGQRFWPLSTSDRPKQFLDLEGCGRTLLQSTFDRLLVLTDEAKYIYVATSQAYLPLIQEQLPDLPIENIILEPTARDSAPAIALASLKIQAIHGEAILGFFPSDHRIGSTTDFCYDLQHAIHLTELTKGIITLGIKPTYPATGFGYIQTGSAMDKGFKVERFVEKPTKQRAQEYLDSGSYFWNAGMFLWHSSTIYSELRTHAPELMKLEKAIAEDRVEEMFLSLPKISIDYALMEKTDKVYVVPTNFEWDDLGDWVALERHLKPDAGASNTVIGNHVGFETQNSIIYNQDGNDLIVTFGVSDLVIVRCDNKMLVTRKDKVQDIKKIIEDVRIARA